MQNRLESISNIDNQVSVQNWEETRKNLEYIKKILQDNPTQEEIDIAKKYLDWLKNLKDEFEKSKNQSWEDTKRELGNLSWELLIYRETQLLIEWLKNKESKESKIETVWYEELFKWTKSNLLDVPKKAISWYVDGNETFKKLDNKKRSNIKLAITSKIIETWVVNSLIWWFSWKVEWYSKALSWKDILWTIDKMTWDDKKSASDSNLLWVLKEQIEKPWILIENFIKKYEKHPELSKFLDNYENISKLTDNTDLDKVSFSDVNWEKGAFKLLQDKIKEYDKKLTIASETKEHILDTVSKLPQSISWIITGFIAFLCSIPFLGDIIKKFMWVDWTSDEIEKKLRWQLEAKKSLRILKSYSLQFEEKWNSKESDKNPAIKILKDKNLSKFNIDSIKENLIKTWEKWALIASDEFWFNIFENNKIEFVENDNNKKVVEIKENLRINDKDFESDKTPKNSFYEKLNKILALSPKPEEKTQTQAAKPEEKQWEQPAKPEDRISTEQHQEWKEREKWAPKLFASHSQLWKTQTPAIQVKPQEIQTAILPQQKDDKKVAEKPQDKKTEAPKQIKLEKNNAKKDEKVLLVDWKKYGISIVKSTPDLNVPVSLDDVKYMADWTLELTWSVLFDKNQVLLEKEDVIQLYSQIKPLNVGDKAFEDNFGKDKDVKVTISAIA